MDQQSKNILEMAKDPMCVPQVGIDPFRTKGESFATNLRHYIEFIHSNRNINGAHPMDTAAIY